MTITFYAADPPPSDPPPDIPPGQDPYPGIDYEPEEGRCCASWSTHPIQKCPEIRALLFPRCLGCGDRVEAPGVCAACAEWERHEQILADRVIGVDTFGIPLTLREAIRIDSRTLDPVCGF